MCATIPSLATTSLYPSFAHSIKNFLTYFEVLFVLAELSCPQTTATFTINIKVEVAIFCSRYNGAQRGAQLVSEIDVETRKAEGYQSS